ncbi:sulfatase-like hydrolase/transferase [Anaerobacillus sp. CMMVII]|uniref:LTA synthase family protein n=1 Tax=Anaerobacillus sp. CMMVII TaxID=2755588 RepID=UPI0021B6E9EB|nr:sulfatase-like hydrolase/transferase [Anaerobacillus sp. CMMVII]MCT8139399.1 sulfatase-like hydrolase/transferase [Anaerobacillus sp. CMMVII]
MRKIWPASDLEMIENSILEYLDNEPFHAYYMTVSGHMQYTFDGNNMARKNQQMVDELPYSLEAKAYLATQVELDKALEYLLKKLEEAHLADKTLIAISSDHYPYGLEEKTIEELSGQVIENQFDLYKNDFIIYTKGMEATKIDKLGSSLDIIPTLSNLLGLEYDSRLLIGRDLFSNSEPIVPFLDRSFITNKGIYNGLTEEFVPSNGGQIDEEYINLMSSIINSKFYYSAKILDTDYYKIVFNKD